MESDQLSGKTKTSRIVIHFKNKRIDLEQVDIDLSEVDIFRQPDTLSVICATSIEVLRNPRKHPIGNKYLFWDVPD